MGGNNSSFKLLERPLNYKALRTYEQGTDTNRSNKKKTVLNQKNGTLTCDEPWQDSSRQCDERVHDCVIDV
eukprot:5153261-Amphidinium_carterae.1